MRSELFASEAQVVRACLDMFKWQKDAFIWRQNTGAHCAEFNGKKRFVRYGFPGSGDLIGIWNKKPISIECKFHKGRQSDLQKIFQERWERAGGIYILAYCDDDVVKALEAV